MTTKMIFASHYLEKGKNSDEMIFSFIKYNIDRMKGSYSSQLSDFRFHVGYELFNRVLEFLCQNPEIRSLAIEVKVTSKSLNCKNIDATLTFDRFEGDSLMFNHEGSENILDVSEKMLDLWMIARSRIERQK